jgi:hypothetical protein
MPVPTDDSARSALIRKAFASELGARWPVFNNSPHRKP